MHTFKLVDRDGRDLGTVSLSRPDNPPGVVIPRGSKPSLRVVSNEPPAGGDGLPMLVVEEVAG
jgi:hypothetical protein